MKRNCVLMALILAFVLPVMAAERGIMVRRAQIYIAPDPTSAKLGEVDRGREVVLLDKSRNWAHVMASITPERDVSGWIVDKGLVQASTPDGDKILFGEASRSELEASRRGGRKGAADDARRLYYRTYEYFPNSPLAGEALYRAADIQWQLEAEDVRTRPSARMRDPGLRPEIDEQNMKLVMKKFGHSKWADLAAFHLIENKLCGDWEAQAKCPEKEAEMYEKYAAERPESPAAAEALYNAAYRRAALIQIYPTEQKANKVDEAKERAKADAQQIIGKYAQSEWAYRARSLVYLIDQNIPTFGNQGE